MYCQKCGKELPNNAQFCSQCGSPVAQITAKAVQPQNGQFFTLTVNRDNQWFAVNPPVQVVVDGGIAYTLENNSSIKIPVTAGYHNVFFSYSFRKRSVDINVISNCALTMSWNRITGAIVVK